jgi:hypothetical protein
MKILIKLIIHVSYIFAYSGDDKIDPDFAISQLEWISTTLKKLDPATLKLLLDQVGEEIDQEQKNGNEPRAKQLKQLIAELGLVESL